MKKIHIHLFMMATDLTASPVKPQQGMKLQHKDSNSSCLHVKFVKWREKNKSSQVDVNLLKIST